MKALIFEQTGNAADVLQLKDIAVPAPGPGQLLIKVAACPVHPADFLFTQGKYRYQPQFPQIAGLEGAGYVEAVGDGTYVPAGSLVSFFRIGAWAEYVVVDETEVVVLPKEFPMEKAAQFQLNPYTAWGLLLESNVKASDWLLLTAGNSTVSKILIQLAVNRGIHTIATVRNNFQIEALKQLGADAAIVPEPGKLNEQIMQITGAKGIQAAVDVVGGALGTEIIGALTAQGHLIVYGLLDPNPVQYMNAQVVFKNLLIKGFGVRSFLAGLDDERKQQMINGLINVMGSDSFQLSAVNYQPEQFKQAFGDSSSNKVLFNF